MPLLAGAILRCCTTRSKLDGAIIYLTEKATLNGYVLRLDLKFCRDDFLICSGNPFHNVGPATQKATSKCYCFGQMTGDTL